MKLIKYIVFFLLILFGLTSAGAILYLNLPGLHQDRITTYIVNKAFNVLGIKGSIEFAKLDPSNKQIVLDKVNINWDDINLHIPSVNIKYLIVNGASNLALYTKKPIINNFTFDTEAKIRYTLTPDIHSNKSLIIEMSGTKQHGSCQVNFKGANLNFEQCHFVLGESAINISGNILRTYGKLDSAKIQTSFENIDLLGYKLLKPFIKSTDALTVIDSIDGLSLGGKASGEIRINADKNTSAIKEENLSGEIKLQDVKLKYDPDFPIAENIKARAFIKGNNINCQILDGNSNDVKIKNGTVNFTWLGSQDSVVDMNLGVAAPLSSIDDFINSEQKITLKGKGIEFANTKGQIDANVKASIPIAENLHTTINIAGDVNNLVLSALKKQIILNNSKLKFNINNNALTIHGEGSLNNYLANLKYKQDIPYTNSELALEVKLENHKTDTNPLINIEGAELLNITYQDSKEGSKVSATADLTKIGIKVPKFDFAKPKGVKCLVNIQSGKSTDNINFNIQGEKDLNISGDLNFNTNTLKIASLNTNSMKNIKGTIQLSKSKTIYNISGQYVNLENYDLFNLFKKKQDNLGLAADINFSKIKLKNSIEMDNFSLKVMCDKEKCFEGKGIASINQKSISAALTSRDSEETWTILAEDAGSFLKALGIYKNMQNGSMSLELNTKRNIIKIGEVPKVMHGKLKIDDFIVTKTPFIARLFSLLSLSIEHIFKTITNSSEIKFKKLDTDFTFEDDMINILNSNTSSSSFDLMFKGSIDLNERKVKLKGATFPSMYGINRILEHTPIISSLLHAKKRKGIIFTPFNIIEKY